MADEEAFDIDIYGDEAPDYQPEPQSAENNPTEITNTNTNTSTMEAEKPHQPASKPEVQPDEHPKVNLQDESHVSQEQNSKQDHDMEQSQDAAQQIASTSGSTGFQVNAPRQAPTQQGVKRKGEGETDDRDVDPGATSALKLGELQWWTTEDDIRGWANQCGVEDEVKELTFNEHKVNGKSKGEAFLEMTSVQAATALKRHISTFGGDQPYAKKYTVIYQRPDVNIFKTNPKDAPQRSKEANRGAYNSGPGYNGGGGFRGGRGGFNRGGGGGGNYNSMGNMGGMSGGMGRGGAGGFNNPMMGGGFNTPVPGGFNSNMMGGSFNNPMSAGFNNRGGMMGGMRGGFSGRGGRGGFNNPMAMGGMPNMMGNMAMGGMPNMMGGMGNMAGGYVNPGFYPQAGANPGVGSQSPAMSQGNPHGAKRPRPE